MSGIVEEAGKERIEGESPSRVRAIAVAVMVGVAAAVLAYRVLRS